MLLIPEEFQHLYKGKEQSHYLDDLVLNEVDLPDNPRVLDAGCGFGGTIFRWYQKKAGEYHGFTLSKYQKKIATREAKRRGISHNCHFYLQSYSESINIKFHAIVAIESLVHSHNLVTDIGNLSRALLPTGKLVIVDDMPLDERVLQTKEYEMLQKYWFLSGLPTGNNYLKLLEQCDLKIISDLDLTPHLHFSPDLSLENRMRRTEFFIRILPIESMRIFLRTHLGGFALQKLYRKGKMNYQLIVAEKQH
jgi:cyclopropane fatty-acyl-phospholipid synthase-like methyltransferase